MFLQKIGREAATQLVAVRLRAARLHRGEQDKHFEAIPKSLIKTENLGWRCLGLKRKAVQTRKTNEQ